MCFNLLRAGDIKLRRNIIPKTYYETVIVLFVLIMIPTVFWYELFLVFPYFFSTTSTWYFFNFLMGCFLLFNVVTNYIGMLVVETSIKGIILKHDSNWHLCASCETVVPPRSWHCDVCNICVLRRDHHCVFTGSCIGHVNMRYFYWFVFYVFVATAYSSCYNFYFVYANVDFKSWTSFISVAFPLAMLMVDQSITQLYLFFMLLIAISCVFTGVLLYYYTNLMLKGKVTPETKKDDGKRHLYDLGYAENVRQVLGQNWHVTWISAFFWSPLPSDGQKFKVNTAVKVE